MSRADRLACVEGKINMAARRQVTNKLRDAYRGASKADKSRILEEVINTTGIGRSTARRLLTGPRLPDPKDQVDRRTVKTRAYSDDAREVLRRVWLLTGCPCGKYLALRRELWLPLLRAAGDLDPLIATDHAIAELMEMSPATIDRYLTPTRDTMTLKGISTTKPGTLLRNSITVRKVGDGLDHVPGLIEVDTVAHCGSTL